MQVSTFDARIEIGNPDGQRFESLRAILNTGLTLTTARRGLLERLRVRATRRVSRLASQASLTAAGHNLAGR
jgi:hypothetical protein